jgi:K+ transporter
LPSGLTVVTVMAITTVLLVLGMLLVWGWQLLPVLAVCGPLLVLELSILAASLPKVAEAPGWHCWLRSWCRL